MRHREERSAGLEVVQPGGGAGGGGLLSPPCEGGEGPPKGAFAEMGPTERADGSLCHVVGSACTVTLACLPWTRYGWQVGWIPEEEAGQSCLLGQGLKGQQEV